MTATSTSELGRVQRLQASGAAQRLYPVSVGVQLARLRAARLWRRPDAREEARAGMELVVGRTPRAAELDVLARRYLVELCKHQELAWRLDVITRLPVQHLERLRQHADAGQGVIISNVHQGHFAAHSACLSRHGVPMSTVIAPRLFGEQPQTASGLRRRQLYRTFTHEPGVTPVNAVGSYARLRDHLRGGGVVLMACDLEGSTPVRFLGRTIGVPSGTARLSLETGAPVLPLSISPHGSVERLEVQEALLPSEHSSPAELMQALFDRHAPAVLAWPEGCERPVIHLHEVATPAEPSGDRTTA